MMLIEEGLGALQVVTFPYVISNFASSLSVRINPTVSERLNYVILSDFGYIQPFLPGFHIQERIYLHFSY